MNETDNQKLKLNELIEATRKHLVSLSYAGDTMRHTDNCWSVLKSFAQEENVEYFTTEFGQRFLMEKYQISLFGKVKGSYKRHLRRCVTILADYQQHGIIYKRQPTKQHVWPSEYHDICESFFDSVVRNRLGTRTQRQYRTHLERFMSFLIKSEIRSMDSIKTDIIDGYFATYIGYKKGTISYACYVLKTFFKYSFANGYINNDLVQSIPAVKMDYRRNLPSVFTKDEIESLLKTVDRCSPQGKRDYAILLLAIRYGMRVGEITALQLCDLNFTTKKITYTQSKTGVQMSHDILENVGWALIDYLKNARPKTDCPNLFVRMIAPYDAFGENNNLDNIMSKYLSRAGIKQKGDNRHYGMHTIRHSFASHLLEKGNPLYVVSSALGHLELNSTMIYTKIDLPMLELCALEVSNDTE